jgi:hypothetical protein
MTPVEPLHLSCKSVNGSVTGQYATRESLVGGTRYYLPVLAALHQRTFVEQTRLCSVTELFVPKHLTAIRYAENFLRLSVFCLSKNNRRSLHKSNPSSFGRVLPRLREWERNGSGYEA